ncbi:putative quinol monooxygenase [Ferrimonas lipolytica]|uniref:Antibiotic biosynthesis monooxygenase n=1 Tax=Ferrimonas lipolytica TaxID=2724191 RepID=A0A6H1UFN6_9GAMM|nr:antibiotic biosynthesis monooxygenase [Ferrimonas lipolytica]QIZ77638.1 antibiotic biosynthesis monooxygenase [Ferrimonas lipolytica]
MLNKIAKFTVKPEQRQHVETALLTYQNGAKQLRGNIAVRIYVDRDNPNLFFTYERWDCAAGIACNALQAYSIELQATLDTALIEPAELFELGETNPLPQPLKTAAVDDEEFIILFIFKIKPELRQRLLQQFEDHVSQTRTEAANLLFELYTINGSNDTLAVYEHWRNEAAVWDIHFNQPYSKITGTLMEAALIGDMKQYMNFVTQLA